MVKAPVLTVVSDFTVPISEVMGVDRHGKRLLC